MTMVTVTLPNLNEIFYNIEGPKDALCPPPDDPKLPPIIAEYDALITDINKCTNNTSLPLNIDAPICPSPTHNASTNTSKHVNAGLAAIAKKQQHKKEVKSKRVDRFKTNNPKTKLKGSRCPWPELI